MRTIKFRAWDKGEEKMYLTNKLSEAEWVLYLSDAIKGKGKPIFMQFTGLKDKNGKGEEVYQSDLIRSCPKGYEPNRKLGRSGFTTNIPTN